MNNITITFKSDEDKAKFKEFFDSVIGISIDDSETEQIDNYGQFKYSSTAQDEIIVESLGGH